MNMKNGYQFIKRILPVMVIGLALYACDTPESASLFDEDYQSPSAPVISSVSPDGGYFAGYQEIVITGSNFTSDLSKLFVYFNDTRVNILSASESQIVVRTPNLVADSIGIKVSVLGVEAFSNSWEYRLDALFRDAVEFPDNENPWASARDSDGNYYVSYEASGAPAGVKKVATDGTVIDPAFGSAQSWFYRSAKVGPDGGVYLVRGGAVPFIYRIDPTGGTPTSWARGIGRTEDLTFDESGNAWSGGTNEGNTSNAKLNRINPAGVAVRFDFDAQIYALAYANNHIYVAGTRGSDSYLWRVELLTDLIPGAEQEVANLTASGAVGRPTALAVAGDGTAFVGMDGANQLYSVSSTGTVAETYPGIVPGSILKMEYVPDSQNILMTVTTTDGNRVIELNVQKDAP
jgi:hypothetical protein